MRRLVAVELFKLGRRRMTWILAVLIVGITALVYAALLVALEGGEQDSAGIRDLEVATRFGATVPFAYRVVLFQIVTIMGVILAGATTGAEFSWRTVVTMTAWTGDRVRLIAARIVALSVFVGAGLGLGFVTAILCSLALNAGRGTFDSSEVEAGLLLDAVTGGASTWFVVMVYVSLAVALAMWTRSTAPAIALPLVTLLLEPLGVEVVEAIGGPLEAMKHFTLSQNAAAILEQIGTIPGLDDGQERPPALRGWGLLLLYTAVTVAGVFFVFVRRDIKE